MKKKSKIIFLSLMVLMIIIPQVSAQMFYIDLRDGVQQIIDLATDFGSPFFEVLLGDYQGSEFFFTKILILLILFIMINTILKKVPLFEGNHSIAMIVAGAVSLIGVRYISENSLIWGIIVPYSTLAIVLSTILPFLIFVWFIYATEMSGLARKAAWVFFGVVFLVLWIYQSDNLSPLGNQIYLWTIIAMVIFIAFDRRISAYFRGQNIREFEEQARSSEITNLKHELSRINQTLATSPNDRQLLNRQRYLQRALRRMGATYR